MSRADSIAFLLSGGEAKASSRFRVFQYFPYLEAAGLECRPLVVQGKGRRSFLTALIAARRAGAVFIQRKLFKRWKTRLLRAVSDRLVFDFDDALFDLNAEKKAALGFDAARKVVETRRLRLDALLAASSLTIVGNGFLRDYAVQKAQRVEIVPTPVTVPPEIPARQKGNGRVVIGWIGGASSIHYLNAIRGALERVVMLRSNVDIKIVSNAFPDFIIPRLEKKRWSIADETADLDSFDIGIMPLDDEYAKGKCALKVLQYFSRGVPAVASPVGANCEVVADGENGFLASTEDDWIAALSRLVEDENLRLRLGEAGYRKAKAEYSLDALAPRFAAALKSVLGASKAGG